MDSKVYTWSDVAQVKQGQRVSTMGFPLRNVPVPATFGNWLQYEPAHFPGKPFFVLPPGHCINHSKFEHLRTKFLTILSGARPQAHPEWQSLWNAMLREVGFAANHFIEMAILQELRLMFPDQPQLVLSMMRNLLASKFCGPEVNEAFVRAVAAAVDALHTAFGPVGEDLRRERDARVQELSAKVAKREHNERVAAQGTAPLSQEESVAEKKQRLIEINRAKNLKYDWLKKPPHDMTMKCRECGEGGHRAEHVAYCLASEKYGQKSGNMVWRENKAKLSTQAKAQASHTFTPSVKEEDEEDVIVPGEPFCSYSDPAAPAPCIPEPRGGIMRFRQSARQDPVKRTREEGSIPDVMPKDDTEGEEDPFGEKGDGASKKP